MAQRALSSYIIDVSIRWIDKLDGAGYSWASALTGRLLPAAREISHLFSFSGDAVTFFQPGISGTQANMKGGLVTPSKFLPSHSSFESIRKQAKKLVRQVAASDPDAVARVHAQLPAPILPLSLRDAQLVLARECGFAGWQDLRAAVLRQFELPL